MQSSTGKRPLWQPEQVPQPYRDCAPRDLDVLIVGGGVAGLSTAWHATSMGIRTMVLEAGSLASRASGRNDGQVLLGLGEHLNRLVGQWGHEDALLLWRFIEENHRGIAKVISDEEIDCSYQEKGGLRLADSTQEWKELVKTSALMDQEGILHRLVKQEELDTFLPLSREFYGALFLEGEAIFDPYAFVHGLARSATAQGLAIREHARACRITGELGDFSVELEDGEEVRCKVLVHASSALDRELDSSGYLARTLFPFRGQILATGDLPESILHRMPPWAMSSNFCYEYFRTHAGRMTLGGMRWSVKGEESGLTDDRLVNPEITEHLLEWLDRHFPDIANEVSARGVDRVWSGIMAGTPDGLPLVGEIPGQPGNFVCTGFNGYGMSLSWLAGRSLAEMIQEGRSSRPAARLFRPDRFQDDLGLITG